MTDLPAAKVADKGKVMVCWLDPGQVEGAFTNSLLQLVMKGVIDGLVAGWSRMECGPMMAWNRNGMVLEFLKNERGDWLLFVDSDMTFPADLLQRLLTVADPETRPVVCGLYYGKSEHGPIPIAYMFSAEHQRFLPITPDPEHPNLRVDGAGTGCMLIHKSVFDKTGFGVMEPGRWFDQVWLGRLQVGEDLSFCLRLREVGLPLALVQNLDIKHLKGREVFDADRYAAAKTQKPEEVEDL